VVASAFFYNAPLAMGALRGANAVQPAFTVWLAGINGSGKRFRRLYDKKVCAENENACDSVSQVLISWGNDSRRQTMIADDSRQTCTIFMDSSLDRTAGCTD